MFYKLENTDFEKAKFLMVNTLSEIFLQFRLKLDKIIKTTEFKVYFFKNKIKPSGINICDYFLHDFDYNFLLQICDTKKRIHAVRKVYM